MPILRPAITLPLPRHPDGVPRLPPARETPFFPRALFTADLAGTRAPRKREKEAAADLSRSNGYYLRTALREFILSFAYTKFEISCLQRVVQSDTR